MAKVKFQVARHQKHKKILKLAKGYWGARHRWYRLAKQAVKRALASNYKDRKRKKRDFRRLWIIRISAKIREQGLTYNRFMEGLRKANIKLNRKILADLAIKNTACISKLINIAKEKLCMKKK